MLFDQYNRVRIISLESRQDRRLFAARQILQFGLGKKAQWFNAIVPDDAGQFISRGVHGCFLSHLGVLREAANAGESVLLIEDDCVFRPKLAAYRMPPCDMFVGGWLSLEDPANAAESDIIGAQLMGFSAETANKLALYLEAMLRGEVEPDPCGASAANFDPDVLPPVDGAYAWYRRAHPELKTIFADLSYQRSSRSDITPAGILDRVPVVRNLVETIRRLRAAA